MIWFKDHLYVGTTRANLHLLWFTMEKMLVDSQCGRATTANPYDLDLRGQIWRYNPRTGQWRQIYLSPMLMGKEGFEVPLSIGFRASPCFRERAIRNLLFTALPGLHPGAWARITAFL